MREFDLNADKTKDIINLFFMFVTTAFAFNKERNEAFVIHKMVTNLDELMDPSRKIMLSFLVRVFPRFLLKSQRSRTFSTPTKANFSKPLTTKRLIGRSRLPMIVR